MTHDNSIGTIKKKLNKEYVAFLKSREKRVQANTLFSMKRRFMTFPENPKELNAEYFKKREGMIISKEGEDERRLSDATLRLEFGYAKQFYKFKKWPLDGLADFEQPKIKRAVSYKDLYTPEQIEEMLKVSDHPRDKAIILVLLESGCRAIEFVSMSLDEGMYERREITYEQEGEDGTIKTRTRNVYIFDVFSAKVRGEPDAMRKIYLDNSVPALEMWINHHHSGKGALWTHKRNVLGKFPAITTAGLDNMIRQTLKRAGIKGKKKVTHMFRHTMATECVKQGIRGAQLCALMGWQIGSSMEQVYTHLSQADTENEVFSKRFKIGKVETQGPIFQTLECICGHINPPNTRLCEKCGRPQGLAAIKQAQETIDEKDSLEKRMESLEQKHKGLLKVSELYFWATKQLSENVSDKELKEVFDKVIAFQESPIEDRREVYEQLEATAQSIFSKEIEEFQQSKKKKKPKKKK